MWPARIYIGTSGWSYEDWVGPFYESEKRMFSQYCEVFNTTEINSSFYTMPTPAFSARLAKAAPRVFVFSAKMVKTVTHRKLLNPKLGVEEDLSRFLEAMAPLKAEGKLGAVLIQMPPKPRDAVPHFEDFLALLPGRGYRFAVEFRDASWLADDVFRTLEKYGVAYTVVDEPLLPPLVRVTADFAYVRWHGRGQRPWYYYQYSVEELKEWVPRVRRLAEEAAVVYGYFNNHFRGFAPRNALQMLQLLGLATKRQRLALKRVDEYFSSGEARRTAEAVAKALAGGSFEELLLAFTGERRLKRAMDIPDSEVRVLHASPNRVEARVKEYRVIIDVEDRVLAHDCADWEKRAAGRKFCKHIAKLFLTMPRDTAKKILADIAANLEDWSFEKL